METVELAPSGIDANRFLLLTSDTDRNGRRWRNQARRRAQVLASARAILSCVGHEKLTLKALAENCGISVQTIFNIVGNKSLVIRESIIDISGYIDRMAQISEGYPCYCLASADVIWNLARTDPECHKQLSIVQMSIDPHSSEAIRKCANARYRRALGAECELLNDDFDICDIADAITCVTKTTMYEWSIGLFDLSELRRNLIIRTAMIMSASMVPSASRRVSEFLKLTL
jgi:AcrR family transcriptional regulator